MIAAVRDVTAAAADAGSRQYVAGSMSAKTGRAPACTTALAVAAKVNAGTMTSSPGPMPAATSPRCRAEVPEAIATHSRPAIVAANSVSKAATSAPWVSRPLASTRSTASRSAAPSTGLAIGTVTGQPCTTATVVGIDTLSPMPVVVGVGRSGTTLLRLMLDAHPDLCLPGETGFLLPVFDAVRHGEQVDAARFADLVTSFQTWPDLGTDADTFTAALQRLDPFSVTAGTREFYRLYAAARGKSRWGDKTPVYGQHCPTCCACCPRRTSST